MRGPLDFLPSPLWFSAVVLVHEYAHAKSAHGASPGSPDATDPAISESDCGVCQEATMHGDDIDLIAALICTEDSGVDQGDACDVIKTKWKKLGEDLAECNYHGCQLCCGFPYIPSSSELADPPLCCWTGADCCQ